jgi:hypothetical protein
MAQLAHEYCRRTVIAFHGASVENSFSVEIEPFPIDVVSQSRKHFHTSHLADSIENESGTATFSVPLMSMITGI